MTHLQKIFLLYSLVYIAIQFALIMGFREVLKWIEKKGRIEHAKRRELIIAKRAAEQERWKVAYALYHKQYENNIPVV